VREEKKKEAAAGFFFFLIYAYAGQCGAGRISAGEKCVYPQPAPPRTGWIKYNPNPSKNTLNPGGSVRFCGLDGFLPSPSHGGRKFLGADRPCRSKIYVVPSVLPTFTLIYTLEFQEYC
jgi:hypothetical protein